MIGESWPAGEIDGRVRNTALIEMLLATLPHRPRLLLLGARSATLLLSLAPRIGRPQVWRVLDADAAAVSDALMTIALDAEALGHTVTYPGHALLIHTGYGALRVEGEQLRDRLPRARDLGAADALVCEHLLPSLRRAWLDALCGVWGGPLLATLNACGPARLLPMRPADRVIRRQILAIPEHRTWGSGAVERAAQVLAARGFRLWRARSDWNLGPDQLGAVRQWLTSTEQRLAGRRLKADWMASWRAERVRQALAGRLRIRLPHQDLLALPR